MYCFSCTGSEKHSSSSEVWGEGSEQDYLHLLLHDQLVLLLPSVRHDALPGKLPAQEVDQHVAQRLQVVAATLLDSHVVVDRRVARRSRETLALVESRFKEGKGGTECVLWFPESGIASTDQSR